MRSIQALILATLLLAGLTPLAGAAELNISGGDSMARTIALQKGKTVTLKLESGQELTGTVKNVTDELAQLTGLSGKEYFDGIIAIEQIEAVLIRTKE